MPRAARWPSLLPDGQLVAVPVADGVGNLAAIQDGSMANVTYNQIVTILNLRQKGPGSKEERREFDEQAQHHRYRDPAASR